MYKIPGQLKRKTSQEYSTNRQKELKYLRDFEHKLFDREHYEKKIS